MSADSDGQVDADSRFGMKLDARRAALERRVVDDNNFCMKKARTMTLFLPPILFTSRESY